MSAVGAAVPRGPLVARAVAPGVLAVPLTRGAVALIDADDYALVAGYAWHLRADRKGKRYARTALPRAEGHGALYMHRLITGAPDGLDVDHRNGDGLDNRRTNIRVATRSQNNQNKQKTNASSGFRNICLRKRGKPYEVNVKVNGVRHYVGTFATLPEAERAASAARRRFMTHAPESAS